MLARYQTENKQRRFDARAVSSTWNGIDFLEVDTDNPTTLVVQLLRSSLSALPLSPASVQIGGKGVAVKVKDASADPQTGRITVILSGVGDSSDYTLRLIRSTDIPVPLDGFDPLLSSVTFSFQPSAEKAVDCGAPLLPRTAATPEPHIDYLVKDFGSFRQLMLDRLAVVSPAWTERRLADMGQALVDVLAYSADYLSYFQDAVGTEAYLGTARQRISVRRHARLLDYIVHEGCNARAFLCLEVDAGAKLPLTLKAGDAFFLSRCTDRVVVDPPDLPGLIERQRPQIFQPLHDVSLNPAHNRISFYNWDGGSQCLHYGATRATIDKQPDPNLPPVDLKEGDLLILEEVLGPETANALDVDRTHRHAVRLTRVTEFKDPARGDRVLLDAAWDEADALPFTLVLRDANSTEISVARGNVLVADHGLTVGPEELPRVPPRGDYLPQLQRRGLTYVTPFDAALPASRMLVQDPRAALPALTLTDSKSRAWAVRPDLLHSSSTALEVVVEIDDQERACLRFGDNVLGARPSPEAALLATYRIGNGPQGNLGTDIIAHAVPRQAGGVFSDLSMLRGVRNPLPSSGGVAAETLDHVRLAAPRAFRTQERAVTEADHAAAARRFPGVRDAASFRRYLGSYLVHFITVVRNGDVPLDEDFKARLLAFLEPFRTVGTEIQIVAPSFVPLDIRLLVHVAGGHLRSTLRESLIAAFSASDLPDDGNNHGRGFFHPGNFSLGQPVFLSQVLRVAMQVPGVASIDITDAGNRFRRLGQTRDELREGRIHIGALELATHGKVDFNLAEGL